MCIQVQYAKKNCEGAVEYFKVLARTVMEDKEKHREQSADVVSPCCHSFPKKYLLKCLPREKIILQSKSPFMLLMFAIYINKVPNFHPKDVKRKEVLPLCPHRSSLS